MQEENINKLEVAVVGGGMAGLAAALYLARGGKSVTLFEKSHELGGRAVSYTTEDFIFNLGPHALYKGGASQAVLDELGISYTGKVPALKGAAIVGGKIEPLPAGLKSLITTGLLNIAGKLEYIKIMASIGGLKPEDYRHITLKDWLQQHVHNESARIALETLARVSTYANAPEIMSAEIFIVQLQMTIKNSVLYLDGGWQTLVDGLEKAAILAGVKILRGAKVEKVAQNTLTLADGKIYQAEHIILGGSPEQVAAMVNSPTVKEAAKRAVPVRAACLNIGLRQLPIPGHTFALGIDQPLYFSTHSAAAKLAPEGGAVIHVAKYLEPAQKTDHASDRAELENLVDLFQPGWRDALVEARFMPNLTVYNTVVTAERGGLSGRMPVIVPEYHNLYVVGDWVGSEGILSDASMASARAAARAILSKSTVPQELSMAGR